MARAAPKVCPRCRLTYEGEGCPRHPRPRRPDPRASAARRGYGAAWRKMRAAFLRAHPTCQAPGCGRPSAHADHRKPRAAGGADHPSNLVALCASCHSRKTAKRDGGFGNPRRPAGDRRISTFGGSLDRAGGSRVHGRETEPPRPPGDGSPR